MGGLLREYVIRFLGLNSCGEVIAERLWLLLFLLFGRVRNVWAEIFENIGKTRFFRFGKE